MELAGRVSGLRGSILAVVLVLVTAWSACGCVASGHGPDWNGYSAGWGEPVTVEGLMRVTVEAPVVDSEAIPTVEVPADGPEQVVVYCSVTIENLGTKPLTYDQADFAVWTGDEGTVAGYEGLTASVGPALLSGVLQPGAEVRGVAPFQLGVGAATRIKQVEYRYWSTTVAATIEWHPAEAL